MNNINLVQEFKNKPGIQQYFLDLSLAGETTWGPNRIVKRHLWIIGCYLSFALGVFARQIFSYNDIITVNQSNANWMSLMGAFAIGMAIFPFALRTIIKVTSWIFGNEPLLRKRQGFNMVHLMASYAIGYFFNFIAQNIPVILSKIG